MNIVGLVISFIWFRFASSEMISNDVNNNLIKLSNSSSFIVSHGILFTLEVNSNDDIEIKSFDIFTTSTDWMEVEIWTHIKTKQYKETEWIQSCCHYPIRGNGKMIATNIPISNPIRMDGIGIVVFMKLNTKSLISMNPPSDIIHLHSSNINRIPGWTISDFQSPSNLSSMISNKILFYGNIHMSNFKEHRDLFVLEPNEFENVNQEFFKSSAYCKYMQQVTSQKSEAMGSYGIMFDLNPSRNIIFETLEFRCQLDRGMAIHYTVFAKSGSYVGFEHNPEAWIKVSQGSLLCAGPDQFTGIPKQDSKRLSLKANKYYGMYVTSNTTDILVGKNDEPFFGDETLHIMQGLSISEYPPFGQTKSLQKIFQGIIHYSTQENCDNIPSETKPIVTRIPTHSPTFSSDCFIKQSIKTKLAAASASFGIMFEIVSKKEDILIEHFQVKSLKKKGTPVKYFIFTKKGPYRQFQTKASAWTKIDENITPSAGVESFTTIPVPKNNPISIESSSIQSVYITFNTPDLLYTKGTQEGKPFVEDDHIQLLEGAAFVEFPPFGSSIYSPRLFTGVLNYSINCSTSQPSTFPSIYPSLYPSLFPTISPSIQPSIQPTLTEFPTSLLSSIPSVNLSSNISNDEFFYISSIPSSTPKNVSNRPSENLINQTMPTLYPTNAPNTLTGQELCDNMYNFSTPVTGNNSTSYGIMFDIQIMDQDLTLQTVAFHCNKTKGESVKYMVYFKPNSFQHFQTNTTGWDKLDEGYVMSKGKHQYTTISLHESIPLYRNNTYSIYFTLEDPDIIYDNEKYDSLNSHIQILEGISVHFYPPFTSNHFTPCFFQGYLQYSIQETCLASQAPSYSPINSITPTITDSSSRHTFSNHSIKDDSQKIYPTEMFVLSNGSLFIPTILTQHQPTDIISIVTNFTAYAVESFKSSFEMDIFIDTSVQFKFVKQYDKESNNSLIELHRNLSRSLQSFIETDSILAPYSKDASLYLSTLQTNVSLIKESKFLNNCLNGTDCFMVESIINTRHNQSMTSEQLRYSLLSQTERITEQIVKTPRISYIGLKAESTEIYVLIKGKNMTSVSIENNILLIQDLFRFHTQDYIAKNDTLSEIRISEMEIIFQEISDRKEKKNEYRELEAYDNEKPQRLREHISGSTVTIKFKMKIEYPSYLKINVGDTIINSMHGARFNILLDLQGSAGINHISDITVSRHNENTTLYHNETETEDFESENITSKDEPPVDEKGWNTTNTLFVTIIPISCLGGLIYLIYLKKKKKVNNSVNQTASERFNLKDDNSKSKESEIWSRSDIEDIQNYKQSMMSFRKLSSFGRNN